MQTLTIDGTTYKVKFDRDPVELAKAARKPYKQKKPKNIRKFPHVRHPAGTPMSMRDYVREFERLNMLIPGDYVNLNQYTTAQYDPTIPLLEDLSNENAN
jgi:hypothetical protein